MKKRILGVLLSIAMVSALVVGCGSKEEESTDAAATEETADDAEESDGDTYTVGITIQSLQNDYWAGVMSKLEDNLKAAGWDYTLIDCDDNSATQISQIENFITSGVDFIMVHPSDADAVETVCGEALDAGIKVMCWDDQMENTTANWVLDNTELGRAIGESAAEFINANYTADKPAQVCVIGYPSVKVLLERETGIKEGLEEFCDEGVYEIVATTEGIETNLVLSNVETVLQANPDCTVFVGIGSGAMNGANEALLQHFGGAGNIPENVGVITTDVTMQQLESLQAGDEAVRAIVGFEGSSQDTADACFEMFQRVLDGEDFSGDAKNVFRPTREITVDDVDSIIAGM